MFTLAHMSDIHLCPLPASTTVELLSKRALGYLSWKWNRESRHQRKALDNLVFDLKKQAHDHISITGDLINLSLPKEFSQARSWLNGLGRPQDVSVVPGNHDAYVKIPNEVGMGQWEPYMASNTLGLKYVEGVSSQFPYVRVLDKIAIVGLSTACPTPWFIHAGKLGMEQVAALEKVLSRLKDDGLFRVILIHHPPLLLSKRKQLQLGLRDVLPLRKAIEKEGAELVLHGHHHANVKSTIPTTYGPVPVIGVPSASIGSHPKNPHSRYNLYKIDQVRGRWRCELTARGKSPDSSKIQEIEKTKIIGG